MPDVVCVTGGSGGIGQALLEQLAGRYQVKALFRTASPLTEEWTRRGCTVVWGDMSDERALTELVRGAVFVFHCAALITGRLAEQQAVNVDGTRTLARLAAVHGCRRFVHVSSVSVYTAAEGGPVFREDAPLAERDDMAVYARTKLRAELAVADVGRTDGLDYVIVRPTCVYGPDVKTFTVVPMDLIAKGLPAVVGAGDGLMDAVYVDDVARALVLAAEVPEASGQTFNIGHQPVTPNEFHAHYGRMLNRPVRRLPRGILDGVHWFLGLVPSKAVDDLRSGVRFIGRTSSSVDRFPSDKARSVLGYEPAVTLPIGMLRVALWGRRRGLVPPTDLSLRSWGFGRVFFSPSCVVELESEAELIEAVRLAGTEGLTVRAIGELHSQAPVPNTDGVCLVLHRYNQIVRVEGTAVTVQGGMQLRALHRALASIGLAVPVSGTIAAQTVAGAVSTATHGGSIHRGALSDYVEAIRLIRADGTVVDSDRSGDSFHALVVSLGLLGIVSTVTLRCVPLFRLQSAASVRPAAEVFDEFETLQRANAFMNMLYYPVTDQVEILSINPSPERVPPPDDRASGPVPERASRTPAAPIGRLELGIVRVAAWLALQSTALQRVLTRRRVGSVYRASMGLSYEMLAFQDREGAPRAPGLLRDMELAVPMEHAAEALHSLREHFTGTNRCPLLPVHIRCAARSESWLSPAYHREVCYIEFWQYPPSDEFTERMQALLEPFGYRFHWGKASRATPAYIAGQYERWQEFVDLRERWDPNGVFGNQYLNQYFGQPRRVADPPAAAPYTGP